MFPWELGCKVFLLRYVSHLIRESKMSTRVHLNSLCAHVYESLLEKGKEIERRKI
jgi:hypothetical protein